MRKVAIITNLRDKSDIPAVFPQCESKRNLPAYKVWGEFNIFDRAKGYVIALGVTGKDMMSPGNIRKVRKDILNAVIWAQNYLGVEFAALTSLTSSITDKGRWLVIQEGVTAAITHGDSYAAGVSLEGLDLIAEAMGTSLEEFTIAIVGAYGLIGKALTMSLCKRDVSLILIGHNPTRLQRFISNLPYPRAAKIKASVSLSDIYPADIIVTATSHPDSLIKADYINKDKQVVVYEVSVPPNLSKATYEIIRQIRPNLLKIDGAMVNIPNIKLGVNVPGVRSGTTFSCWAEAIIQCLENDHSDHIGEIDISYMERILVLGRKYGFLHAPFTSFGKLVDMDSFHKLLQQKNWEERHESI